MPQPKWSEVDAYFADRLAISDPALDVLAGFADDDLKAPSR